MATCLITGSAGFIGSHLSDALIAQNHTVVGIDNLSTGSLSNINPQSKFINRSIVSDLSDIFEEHKFDYVFHLAAQINLRNSILEPKFDAITNIIGSLNLIENAIKYKVKHFIFSSSGGAIYSENQSLPFSEKSIAKPASPYGQSKLTIEQYLEIFGKLQNLRYTVLRYSNVYGSRQNNKSEAGVISIFVGRALKNEDLIIFGDGNQTRDFIFVPNVVNANILAMQQQLEGIFNVGSNKETSVNTIANKVIELTGSKSKIKYKAAIPGEMKRSRLNNNKLVSQGWSPGCDIDYGIRDTIEYFRNCQDI